MNRAKFKKLPILGIVRGIEADAVEPLINIVISSGLGTIEIAMNTKGAGGLIRKAVTAAKGRLAVGAGTVTDTKSLEAALEAGAAFIVMPAFVEDVVRRCVKSKIPVFPGALTPKEISEAWNAGVTMVKVFPSQFFGPAYFREIKGPFDKIELLACGGVTPDNMKDYFAAGAGAVAFGASVFRKEWLVRGDFASIGKRVTEYVTAFANIKGV